MAQIEDMIEQAMKEGFQGGIFQATTNHDPACPAPEGKCSCGAKVKVVKVADIEALDLDDDVDTGHTCDHTCDEDCQEEALSFDRWFIAKFDAAVAEGKPVSPHAKIVVDAIRGLMETQSAAMGMHLACLMLVCHPENLGYQHAMIRAISGCPAVRGMIASYMKDKGVAL